MTNGQHINNGHVKSVPEVIAELKAEFQEFVSTRVAMLRAEFQENLQSLKAAAPMLAVGLLMLITGWLLLTGFLVAIIGIAFQPGPWAYVISLIIVTAGYLLIGGMLAMAGWKRMIQKGLKPERTIRVLQQDKLWIQAESKAQL